MRKLSVAYFLVSCALLAQNSEVIKPGDNLVVENIPPIPAAVAQEAQRYGEFRSAALLDWHPARREMLISTRFADVPQVHWVKTPGGERQQMTFFPDRVLGAQFPGKQTDFFVFQKDVGGGEWYQFYRFDVSSGAITLLTDGKSRNGGPVFEHEGTRVVFSSTRRNNKDTDLWMMDTRDPKTAKMLLQVEGGGWGATDWSRDGSQLLIEEGKSANDSNLYLLTVATGEKRLLTPKKPGEQTWYGDAHFTPDGRGFYALTDRDNEFHRLAYFDVATATPHYLTSSIRSDVEEFDVTEDGSKIAIVTNENGTSKLYLGDGVRGGVPPSGDIALQWRQGGGEAGNLPQGIYSGLRFHRNGRDLGFAISSAKSPSDVYSLDTQSGRVERWTMSETGGLNPTTFVEPQLIPWKSFDGSEISGWLYQPNASKFPGKRPVIINIHGGPEGQSRPGFLGRTNYFLDELGVAVIFPNVRGSTGYGKTFLASDNATNRDKTYKDIGALLDWVGTQPSLDATRIMVTGGSYGGHMTWATAAYYNDKIRCALPIVGMSNLVTFLEHTEAYRRDLRRVEYGDERDPQTRAYLEKTAPMNHVDQMHKPIFAVVGKNDPRVPWTESRQILDKLKAQGTPTWFLMANDEGHGYAKKKNQDFLFDAEVMFVKKYLLDQDVAGDQRGNSP